MTRSLMIMAMVALSLPCHALELYRTHAHAWYNRQGDIEISSQLASPPPPPAPRLLLSPTNTLSTEQLFRYDSAALTPSTPLRLIAQRLHDLPATTVMITGYTDSRGSTGYNLALSTRRAKRVQAFLAARAPQHTYEVKGRGEANPIATNLYHWGRAQNRRVTIFIQPGSPAR